MRRYCVELMRLERHWRYWFDYSLPHPSHEENHGILMSWWSYMCSNQSRSLRRTMHLWIKYFSLATVTLSRPARVFYSSENYFVWERFVVLRCAYLTTIRDLHCMSLSKWRNKFLSINCIYKIMIWERCLFFSFNFRRYYLSTLWFFCYVC